ncbi:unnamed protein product [Allacma fusca]|uniref:G-protein coupled receptors family 1 profile domain-containing protein n=1 Tax=Allacma fusca TaxID=39272 RepID=A0A8J2P4S1_9HEXA|nr:unnamed protein product [Allacma fusca]
MLTFDLQRLPRWLHNRWHCLIRLYESFGRFCRVDRDQDDVEDVEDEHASPGCGTPASIETPLQSSVSRCTSLNVIRDPLAQTPTRRTDSVVSPSQQQQQSSLPTGSNGKLPGSDSVYTILIRIPGETEGKNASIRMIQEPGPLPPLPVHPKAKMVTSNPDHGHRPGSPLGTTGGGGGPVGRRTSSAMATVNSKLVSKNLTGKGSTTTLSGTSTTTVPVQVKRKKKKNQEKKQEKKAAKTLSAILLAFIVTWTPYNILVLLRTVLSNDDPIPSVLWDMAYYLCYINSTINPMCYALCNASFRRTYVRILTCKWDNSRRQAVNRGYYN